MRVLILHSRYLSGDVSGENRVVEDEAQLLSAHGHQVSTWTPSAQGVQGLGLLRAGAETVWSRRAAERVRRLIHRTGSEVVHCHNLFPMLSPTVIRAAAREAPVVMTLHNYRLLCLPGTLLRDGRPCEDCLGRVPWPGVVHRCYRGSTPGSMAMASSLALHRSLKTFDLAQRLLAVSGFVKDKHVQAGMAEERITVKPNFAWPAERRSGPGDYFLYLGRLSAEKGVATLLSGWDGRGASLLIVGSGPEESDLRSMASGRVTFRSAVPSREVPELIRGARAVLLPSLGYEGQPRVALEAYAAGVPVIASRAGGLVELVEDGRSGILVPPRPEAWREAVGRLLDDREAERLGAGAREVWDERFSPARGIEALEAVYRQVAGRGDQVKVSTRDHAILEGKGR